MNCRAPMSRPGAEPAPVRDDSWIEIRYLLPPQIERKLGYFGEARFVMFRYDPRAADVIWQDERTFGIATGAWRTFHEEIEPLAESDGVHLGSDSRAPEHVLLLDRGTLAAYFAPHDAAKQFLSRRGVML